MTESKGNVVQYFHTVNGFERPSTMSTSFPISRFGRKSMYGYLRLEGRISSSCIFSKARFLDVACFDFDALAENLDINSCNSLIFSSFFRLASFICLIEAGWTHTRNHSFRHRAGFYRSQYPQYVYIPYLKSNGHGTLQSPCSQNRSGILPAILWRPGLSGW